MTRGLKSMKDVVFLVSTVFKNPKIRLWMKWALLKQVGMVVCFKPFDQKMIDIGFKREWQSNILLYMAPIVLAFASVSKTFLVKGKINYYIWMFNCLLIGVVIWTAMTYIDCLQNRNYARTYVFFMIRCLIYVVWETCSILELGFINSIVDQNVGGTHMTLQGCIAQITKQSVECIALNAAGYIPYQFFFVFSVVYMAIVLYCTRDWPKVLDETDPSEFMINMKSNQDDVLTGYEDNELYDSKDCEGEEEGKRKAGLLCKWKNV